MKRILVIAAVLACAVALNASAQDATKTPAPASTGATTTKKAPLTAEQKKLQKEMTAKYDTDKNGKLSKEEKAKISADDKKKMTDAGLGPKKKAAK